MDKEEYDENCRRMQKKMIGIAEALLEKVKSTQSPIDYLVTMRKLNKMMEDHSEGFAILANMEYAKLREGKKEGDDIVMSGAIINEASGSYDYDYPETVNIMESALKKAKEFCRNDGSAKKGDRRNKRDFIISLP